MAVLMWDLEIYQNYFLCAFKRIDNGKVFTYEMFDGQDLDRKSIAAIIQRHTIVSFNGINFDAPLLALALSGATCAVLKEACDAIIRHHLPYFVSEKQYGVRIPKFDHIDLMELAPGVQISLKTYQGRLHGKRMQDLPYSPASVLTREEMEHVRLYCVNDLDATENLWHALAEPLALRIDMGAKFNFDFRSKSDAQVSESLVKLELEKLKGKGRIKKAPRIAGIQFKYNIPDYIRFDSPQMNEMLDKLREHTFVTKHDGKVIKPEFMEKTKIRIGDAVYTMGIGGLHSTEKGQAYRSDATYVLVDNDVASYYPNVILGQELFPKHLGPEFLKVFGSIVRTRIAAKNAAGVLKTRLKDMKKAGNGDSEEYAKLSKQMVEHKNIADSLKIAINGIFGKFGSAHSILFAPELMIQTTLSGQLVLMMLIERAEALGIKIVSGNTDGIVAYAERSRWWVLAHLIWDLEVETGLEMEYAIYSSLNSRDVNNYIAIKPDGSIKGKGVFANPMAENDMRGQLQKNPESAICIEAAVARIHKGTPVWDTIRACKDVRKFISVRKEASGAHYGDEYLGKTVRWYYGYTSLGHIHGSRNANKVANSEGAVPIMELPDGNTLPSDINYEHYIHETLSILEDLTASPVIDHNTAFMTFFRKCVLGMKR